MPTAAELPPGLALLAHRPPLSLGAANPEGDVGRVIQVLDQSIAERQGTETSMAVNQPTVTGMAPSWGRPVVQGGQPQPGQPQPGQPQPGQPQPGQPQPGQPQPGQPPPGQPQP